MLNVEKLEAFPLRSGPRMSLSPLLLTKVLEVLASAIREEKERKDNGEEDTEWFLFADDVVIYVENRI